jgi:hypothetical protein
VLFPVTQDCPAKSGVHAATTSGKHFTTFIRRILVSRR